MTSLPLRKIKKLYYKEKLGVPEISQALRVSMRVLYKFMRANNLPRRNLVQSNKILFQRKRLSFFPKQYLTQKEKQLKLAGLMLYWAEGAATGRTVDLANSNVEMVRLFLKFLRRICQVDEKRLRVFLYCYGNQDQNELMRFWSRVTNIPLSQFSQPYVRYDYAMKAGRSMLHGLVHVRYSDKKLLHYLLEQRANYLKENL